MVSRRPVAVAAHPPHMGRRCKTDRPARDRSLPKRYRSWARSSVVPSASLDDKPAVCLAGPATVGGLDARVQFRFDRYGRYSLAFDSSVPLAEGHDGTTTWKLRTSGQVASVEGMEKETSHALAWVLSGYWLSPLAPLRIEPGVTRGGRVELHLYVEDGRQPFALEIDGATWRPCRMAPLDGSSRFKATLHGSVREWPGAPRRVVVSNNGVQQFTMTFTEFERLDDIEASLEPPACLNRG